MHLKQLLKLSLTSLLQLRHNICVANRTREALFYNCENYIDLYKTLKSFKDRDTQKIQWIDRFIEELRTNDKWVIPALKQIREICSLFGEAPQNLR